MRIMRLNGYAPRRPERGRRSLPRERNNCLTLIDLTEENNTRKSSGEDSALISASYQLDYPRIGIIRDSGVEKEDSYNRQPCST